ncbi:MAG TPA: DUF1080 domain-containing protein [Chitinophagaceae bacterium]|jgi:hypothetical protein|nr:DUF1080 domain-containing protein [Chitinophagaceae bacterium]
MKRINNLQLLLLALALAFASCQSAGKLQKEQASQWVALFNGKNLEGWRIFRNKPSDSWEVKDGLLHCKGSRIDKSDRRGDLLSIGEYENFELRVDWKISPAGNSGIMYLVTEQDDAAYKTGPEYQLIDDKGFPAKLENWQRTGANYAMNPPTSYPANPAGEWNETRILVRHGHVEHWLNGVPVVQYELWTPEWEKNRQSGKWKDAPLYGRSRKGHICLQDHGSEAWFRNIEIKVLD